MERAIIRIDLPKYLEHYLRAIFDKRKGLIVVHRKHEIGLHISGLVRYSNATPRNREQDHPVEIALPKSNLLDTDYHYVYLPPHNERQVVDFIKASFALTAQIYFNEGYARGYRQSDIIDAFIDNYHLGRDTITYESVKKNDYRRRVRIRKEIAGFAEKSKKKIGIA